MAEMYFRNQKGVFEFFFNINVYNQFCKAVNFSLSDNLFSLKNKQTLTEAKTRLLNENQVSLKVNEKNLFKNKPKLVLKIKYNKTNVIIL